MQCRTSTSATHTLVCMPARSVRQVPHIIWHPDHMAAGCSTRCTLQTARSHLDSACSHCCGRIAPCKAQCMHASIN
eukprot:gene11262-biopygen15403